MTTLDINELHERTGWEIRDCIKFMEAAELKRINDFYISNRDTQAAQHNQLMELVGMLIHKVQNLEMQLAGQPGTWTGGMAYPTAGTSSTYGVGSDPDLFVSTVTRDGEGC